MSRRKPRILVVDDEINARRALGEILRDEGYEVDLAPNGQLALPRLADFKPDVVLTDIRMPGIDGLTLALIAGTQDPPPPSVILMSAFQQPKGVSAPFLSKPVDVDKLLSTVEQLLESRES